MTEELWEIERSLWLDGVESYRRRMSSQCVMVFPKIGAMDARAVLDSLAHAPRWDGVNCEDKMLMAPADAVRILVYRATAHREGSPPYHAYCVSSYVKDESGWRIASHQQTPA